MQRAQQIPTLPLTIVNRTEVTNNTKYVEDNTNRTSNNTQQNICNENVNSNSDNNIITAYNVKTALDAPEIPTTRGPHHINCNSSSIRANISNLSINYNATNNNNATVKLTGALLCRPPSRPPSHFTTPRVDLTSRSNQQENITNQNKTFTSPSQNHIEQKQQSNMYIANSNNLEHMSTANIIDNNNIHSNPQLNTQNEVANHVPICDFQPNSNSIRFSVARSEPSIIFRVHNDNAEGNNNVNCNISSTVPFYRWSDVKDGRESYVPFEITRDNSPAMTILNVQSEDENAQHSRLSSDIHFMIDDVKSTINSNYKEDNLCAHMTEHHEPQIEQHQHDNVMFIPNHNTVNANNNNLKDNSNNARRVLSSMASSINFVEYSASSRNETLNCTDTTQMNVETKPEEISNQEQEKKISKYYMPQSVITSMLTLKLNNVVQRATVINKNNNIQTAQTARANRNRGNCSSRVAVTARSSNQIKNKNNYSNNNNNNNNKKLVTANAVSARIIRSTSNGQTPTPTSTKAAAIKHKRRPFIPSSRNALVRDANSARGTSTEHVASPVTMREFAFGNNNLSERQIICNDIDKGQEGAANSVERIRHNAHYERPWRVTVRSSSLLPNTLSHEQEQQQEEKEERYRITRNKINWEPSATPLRLPPLRFSGKPLVSFHDQWITHHHHQHHYQRKPPVKARMERRKGYEHIHPNEDCNSVRRYSNNNAEIKQKIANTLNANLESNSHQHNFTNATFLRQISNPQSTEQSAPALLPPQHQEFVQQGPTDNIIMPNNNIINNDINNYDSNRNDIHYKDVQQVNAVHLYTPRPRSNYTKPWRADIATPRGQRRDVWRDAFIQEDVTTSHINNSATQERNDGNNNMINSYNNYKEVTNAVYDQQVQEYQHEQSEEIETGDICSNNGNQNYQQWNEIDSTNIVKDQSDNLEISYQDNAEEKYHQHEEKLEEEEFEQLEKGDEDAVYAQSVDNLQYSMDDAEALPRAIEETPLPHPRSTHNNGGGGEAHKYFTHSRAKNMCPSNTMQTESNTTTTLNNEEHKLLSYEEPSIEECQMYEELQEEEQQQEEEEHEETRESNNTNVTIEHNDGMNNSVNEFKLSQSNIYDKENRKSNNSLTTMNTVSVATADEDVEIKSNVEPNTNMEQISSSSSNNNMKKSSILSYLEREVDEWMECVTEDESLSLIANVMQRRQIDLQNALTSFNNQSDTLREVTWQLYSARDAVLQIREAQSGTLTQSNYEYVNKAEQTNSIHYNNVNNYDNVRKYINDKKSAMINDESRNQLMNSNEADSSHYYYNTKSNNNNISNSEYSTSDHVNYVIHHPPERETNNNDNNSVNEVEKRSLSISPFDIHKLLNETGNSENALIAHKRVSGATHKACQRKWTQWEEEREKLFNELQRLRQQHNELQFHVRRGTHIKPLLLPPNNSSRRFSLESANEHDSALHLHENNELEGWTLQNKQQHFQRNDDVNDDEEELYKALLELRLEAQECRVSVERKEGEWQLLRRRCAEHKQMLLRSLHEVQDREAMELEHQHQSVQALEEKLRELVVLRRNVQQCTLLHPMTRRNALHSINDELEHGERVLSANKNRLISLERSAASSLKRMAKRESIDYEY